MNTQHQVVQGRSQPQTHQVMVVVQREPKIPNEESRGVCVCVADGGARDSVLPLGPRLCSQTLLSLPAALRHGRPRLGIHNDLASGVRNVVIGLCVGVVCCWVSTVCRRYRGDACGRKSPGRVLPLGDE